MGINLRRDSRAHFWQSHVAGDLTPWITKFSARTTEDVVDVVADYLVEAAGPPEHVNHTANLDDITARERAARLGRIATSLGLATLT